MSYRNPNNFHAGKWIWKCLQIGILFLVSMLKNMAIHKVHDHTLEHISPCIVWTIYFIWSSNPLVPGACIFQETWWRHQMETFSALLAICAGNSPVPGEFPTQRPVTRSFDVYFDLRPNKRLSKQSWGWWFETLSCSLWRHRNEYVNSVDIDVLVHCSNKSSASMP